ncbi:TrbM/KikA/MpfK family conjugal transfer protein (plasmid) [Pseudomonas sp. WOUb67]|uniref:TrbM/KikA/MpfK family conjugal transfer protein n=1 Tax=Pseudomonas sp. WOUb67 TaxID=3161136 RepID=UPI003CEFC84F
MKKVISALFVTFALLSTSAHAKDPCETVLCMAGMLQGKGIVEGCDGAVSDFFSIIKRKKKNRIDINGTFNARKQFVNSCPQNSGWGNKISNKYGRIIR